MLYEGLPLRERLVAHLALIGLLSSVSAHVSLQSEGGAECLVAHETLVRLLSGVGAKVALEMVVPPERLPAHFTLVRPLPRVDEHVLPKVTVISELDVAHFTLVWPLTGVRTDVSRQVLFIRKRFAARPALIGILGLHTALRSGSWMIFLVGLNVSRFRILQHINDVRT